MTFFNVSYKSCFNQLQKLLVIVVFLISQDIQTDAPFHLLHLKVEVERSKLMVLLQECQAEVTRENRHLAGMGSERLIKEHRVSTERLVGWQSFMY